MAKHTITSDRSTQLKIKTDGDTWTLNAGADILVNGTPAMAIWTGADNSTVNINGRLLATGGEGIGIFNQDGEHNTFNIGAQAEIHGGAGMYSYGRNTTVNNKGDIGGIYNGLYMSQAAHVTNSGEISGMIAVTVGGEKYSQTNETAGVADFSNVVINQKNGEIWGGDVGVYFAGETKQKLVNDGLISSAANLAVTNYDGTLHIVNRGRIDGNIDFGPGADILDTRLGVIHGKVEGGEGNDTYLISNASLAIGEDMNGGDDTVKTTTTYTLADNVERLVLLGKAGISAFGNAGNNIITGNSGNNAISGMDGADMLDGGKGNDNLHGGMGADTFLFHKGGGKDVVADFENGTDHISLVDLPGATSFSDLASHISQHGNDVWLTFDADRLVLTGIQKADIDATDFLMLM